MTLIYRAFKGVPLTIEEVDGNFKELNNRLEALEQINLNPFSGPVSSFNIEDFLLLLRQQEAGEKVNFLPNSLVAVEGFRERRLLTFFDGTAWYEVSSLPITFPI